MTIPDIDAQVIGLPLGSRISAIVLQGTQVHVWIALKKAKPDYQEWQGTFIRVENNGRVTRVTVDDAYTVDDEFVIKPANNAEERKH